MTAALLALTLLLAVVVLLLLYLTVQVMELAKLVRFLIHGERTRDEVTPR